MSQKKTTKKRGLTRRSFLKVLGLTGAASAVAPRSVFAKGLYPILNAPADRHPTIDYFVNSICNECAAGCSLTVRNREGRIVKLDGNTKSPTNAGAICARGQAFIHKHYHPDRIKAPFVNSNGDEKLLAWEEAKSVFSERLRKVQENGRGSRVRVLGPVETGSLGSLITLWTKALGAPKPVEYEAVAHESLVAASQVCFGANEAPDYKIDKATYLVSFGADFLDTFGNPTEYSAAYGRFRSAGDHAELSDHPFHYVGPRMTPTAISADYYHIVPPGKEHYLALAMLHVILDKGMQRAGSPQEISKLKTMADAYSPKAVAGILGLEAKAIEQLARSFANAESPLAIGGGASTLTDEATHSAVAVNLLNYVCGAVNRTVLYGAAPSWAVPQSYRKAVELVEDMKAGKVDVLITYGANPAYALPTELGFTEAAAKVGFKVAFSVLPDETTALADLVIPMHTTLESWTDFQPRRGVRFVAKPAMKPVLREFAYSREYFENEEHTLPTGELPASAHVGDFLLDTAEAIGGKVGASLTDESFENYLKSKWRKLHAAAKTGNDFDTFFEEALQNGGFWKNLKPKAVKLASLSGVSFKKPAALDGMAMVAYPHVFLFDGRSSNLPLLQELPDPVSSVAWGSFAECSINSAAGKQFQFGSLLNVKTESQSFDVPMFAHGAVSEQVVGIALGQGRRVVTPFTAKYTPDTTIGLNANDYLPVKFEALSGGPVRSGIAINAKQVSSKVRVAHAAGSFDQLGRGIVQAETPDGKVLGYTKQDTLVEGAYRKVVHVDTSKKGEPLFTDKEELGHSVPPIWAEQIKGGETATAEKDHGDSHNGNGHGDSPGNGHGDSHGTGHGKADTHHGRDDHGHDDHGHGKHETGVAYDHHSTDYQTIYEKQEFPNYRWGMVIDLDKCNGCGACAAACYTENNVPVVGKERMMEGREMSWLYITRYEMNQPDTDTPRSGFSLMLCQQCTNAPCEPVCPVLAAYHTDDGINAQVYNRCIGTRYCANNCPYKVRRFNYFDYRYPDFLSMSYNPDIYVRPAGVMEKCTFCIQRIRKVKSTAKDEKRLVKDNEMIPACQQSCPTGAITFGNLLDPESDASKKANSERAYRVLDHHGPDPAIYYLRKVIRKG